MLCDCVVSFTNMLFATYQHIQQAKYLVPQL
jgi:hypothetical protein